MRRVVVVILFVFALIAAAGTGWFAREAWGAELSGTGAPVREAGERVAGAARAAGLGYDPVPGYLFGAQSAVAGSVRVLQEILWAQTIAEARAVSRTCVGGKCPEAPASPRSGAGEVTGSGLGVSAGSGSTGDCTGFAVPDYIIRRESGGDPGAYNSSSGAIGCTQTLISHYRPGGTCDGDDPYTVEGQRDCTQRLVDVAGLAPWGG